MKKITIEIQTHAVREDFGANPELTLQRAHKGDWL